MIGKQIMCSFNPNISGVNTNDLGRHPQTGCSVCGLKFTDSFGRPIAMGYCCPRNNCPSQLKAV